VDKARYLVEAHVLEGRSVGELAAAHGVHRSWIYKLLARYRDGGFEALEPRSRRPRSCKHGTPEGVVEAVVKLRSRLSQEGLIRFQAELPNEMWQTDITHWELAGGEHSEILDMIDDHSRLFLASQAFSTVKARDVVDVLHTAAQLHGLPACLLSDNGAVFTATPRKGKVLLQTELERLGIASKNSRPYHPQTCGKVERLHQTLKRYLEKQRPAETLAELQGQLDTFVHYYNDIRPHRALGGRTPLQAYSARVKARPLSGNISAGKHYRVRNDRVDAQGKVSLRYMSKLHHIGLGRAHKGRQVKLLVADQSIRVIALDGELIRELTLDPSRDYQPLGRD